MIARPSSYGFVAVRKLHCLIKPIHSGVLVLAKRPRNADKKAGGQRPANAKNRKSKSRKSKRLGLEAKSRSPNQEVLDHEART